MKYSPFRFPDNSGLQWVNHVDVLSVSEFVEDRVLHSASPEQIEYAIQKRACHILANKLLEDVALKSKEQAVQQSKRLHDDVCRVEYRFQIAVVRPDTDNLYFVNKMESANKEGYAEGYSACRTDIIEEVKKLEAATYRNGDFESGIAYNKLAKALTYG